MKGIPAELHYETLNKTIQKMPAPASLVFLNIFNSQNYPSDRIRWLLEYGTAGMTPFVAPGAPAPTMGDDGLYGEGSAAAAYWKEKAFIDETRFNNLREPLSQMERLDAQRQIARQQRRLRNRCDRRREWMMAKAFFDNSITYQREGGTKFTVNYGVPERNQQTLAGTDNAWDDGSGSPGSTATPIKDIYDIKKDMSEDVGVSPTDFFLNSETLKLLLFNSDLQDLLKSSAFGNGDLFARPAQVLGSLLGLGNLTVYDDLFEIGAWLSSDQSVTANSSSTISVDDATDFYGEGNAEIRLYDLTKPYTYRKATIDSVSVADNEITVIIPDDDGGTTTYSANRCRVVMRKKFIPDYKIGLFARSLDGEGIAEFMNAPFGLGRNFGMYADSNEEWDPEGIFVRIQNKGLPVLYFPECIYTLTVA